ncbi:calcium-binding protein [Microvirga flavescens]|uniref:calcium-binding protein n=1 Tax=Microvirga flavescens TaxID=2249811 RepID=UPI0013006200|nr:calcium-binding protein [Microvirga flavescens]
MAWYAPISGTTAVNSAANGESIFIGPTVTLSVTGSRAIYFQGTGNVADIYGTVVSTTASGIRLGDGSAAQGHTIDVHAGAFIRGYGDTGFVAFGYGTQFTNAGDIFGSSAGVVLNSANAATSTTLVNSGTIAGRTYGVLHNADEAVTITNSGLIQGKYAFYASGSIDTIINTGRIVGIVELSEGDDVYSGASGRLSGLLSGGLGNDTATGGIDDDSFSGGLGNDLLMGGVGNDTLLGDEGNDKLHGGLGRDILTGGVGMDIFAFDTALSKSGNVDTITDFSHADDTIWLSKAIFKGAGTGALKSKVFYKGAKAHDADDRIIYDKGTGALYYDPDGTGSKAQIKIATLANKPVDLAHNDFLLV